MGDEWDTFAASLGTTVTVRSDLEYISPLASSGDPLARFKALKSRGSYILTVGYMKARAGALLEMLTEVEDDRLGQHIRMNRDALLRHATVMSGLDKPHNVAMKACCAIQVNTISRSRLSACECLDATCNIHNDFGHFGKLMCWHR
jgi:hypothetical protein